MTEGRFPDREPPLGVFVPCELPRSALTSGNTGRVATEQSGGGYEIRSREGLPPTRFPIPRLDVQECSAWAIQAELTGPGTLLNLLERRWMRLTLRLATVRFLRLSGLSSCSPDRGPDS
jgi:hypothetical protein